MLAQPDWRAVARGTFVPTFHWQTAGWLVTVVGLIGTTISPYMQFFLAVGRRREGLARRRACRSRDSTYQRIDSGHRARRLHDHRERGDDLSWRTSHGAHIVAAQAADFARRAATAGGRIRGRASSRFGILNAGVFTATVLPLSTAYIVCEAFGFEAAVDRKFARGAGLLHAVRGRIVIGAAIVLIPHLPLLKMVLLRAGRCKAFCCRPNSC